MATQVLHCWLWSKKQKKKHTADAFCCFECALGIDFRPLAKRKWTRAFVVVVFAVVMFRRAKWWSRPFFEAEKSKVGTVCISCEFVFFFSLFFAAFVCAVTNFVACALGKSVAWWARTRTQKKVMVRVQTHNKRANTHTSESWCQVKEQRQLYYLSLSISRFAAAAAKVCAPAATPPKLPAAAAAPN